MGRQSGLFGTNPIAFAAPRPNSEPLVIDLALTEVARGKIITAAQKGEPIPEGWANDADGNPTTDAAAALKGTLTPIGGAKGAALALMVELMAAALTGANLAFQASSFFDADGTPPGIRTVPHQPSTRRRSAGTGVRRAPGMLAGEFVAEQERTPAWNEASGAAPSREARRRFCGDAIPSSCSRSRR